LNKKNPCDDPNKVNNTYEPDMDNLIVKKKDDLPIHLTCNYCQKSFSRIDSLNRHVKLFCQNKDENEPISQDNNLEMIRQELLSEMNERLKNELKSELMNELRNQFISENEQKDNKIVNNTNIVTNINNGNTLNIQLVAYGKEDKTFTDLQLLKMLNKGFLSVPELFKMIHYDKMKPENQNIFISNIRSDCVLVFNGNDWEVKSLKDTIQDIFDDGRNFLLDKKDELKEKVAGKEKLMNMIAKFERFDYDIDHYPNKKKEIFNELKYMMYNARNMVGKTKKSFEDQQLMIDFT
jgi:hypothetical protein